MGRRALPSGVRAVAAAIDTAVELTRRLPSEARRDVRIYADLPAGDAVLEVALPVEEKARAHPVVSYLAGLAPGSRRTMRGALEATSRRLAGGTWRTGRRGRHARLGNDAPPPEAFPWHELRRPHMQVLRAELAETFAPATANKMLAAIKGVLKECWRQGLMSADHYQGSIDVPPVKGQRLMRGRALAAGELRALVDACKEQKHPTVGMRDAALIGVLFSGGLRRAEAVALELGDYTPDTGALAVRHAKGDKQRIVYLANGAKNALEAWLRERGDSPGPLFAPVNKGGKVLPRAMTAQAVRNILRRRGKDAAVDPFSPHDLRRTCASELWDAGVDGSTIQRILGHESINTTARYDRRPEKAIQEATGGLHYPF